MKPPSMIDIFKQWNLLRNLIVAGGIYFIVQYNYYGSLFAIQALKGNIYFNGLIGAVADTLGAILLTPVLKKFKRKTSFFLLFILSLVCSFSFLAIHIP